MGAPGVGAQGEGRPHPDPGHANQRVGARWPSLAFWAPWGRSPVSEGELGQETGT